MGAAIDSRRQSLVNRQGPAATVETVPLGRLHSGESRLLFPAFGGKRGFRVAVIVGSAVLDFAFFISALTARTDNRKKYNLVVERFTFE